ncbi:hypothetical protein [Christiangramia flava]|uniref:Uncharacterized protein n=1 Tax=Christiangramia flava JLT2011 TaxID=1229726 RepID=A0A1L7I6H0_9FLAO|nr:hypothetical protein [Christiangramia flava]APU69190.1 hypothetical protein GRFL_2466 [Christiangramia flava JLT2011]OSS38910.1 hypothetical protein C723_2301 [Christiangramia flava JLT2011]
MRVFKEEQSFRKWWMFAVLLVNLAVVLSPFFLHDFADAGMNKGLFFALAIMAIVYLFIFSSSLHTRIDAGGIKTWFTPFNLFRKDLKWSEIDGIYLRKYNALTEYGGIGVRGLGKSQSYNIGGNTGIQIEYTQSKKLLIGTRKPSEAQSVLNYYQNKIKRHAH